MGGALGVIWVLQQYPRYAAYIHSLTHNFHLRLRLDPMTTKPEPDAWVYTVAEIRRFLLTASTSMPRILKAGVDDITVTTTDERGNRRTYQRAEIESLMTAKRDLTAR